MELPNMEAHEWKKYEAEHERMKERLGELEDQISYAYAAMGNYLHEAFGWEKKQDDAYKYDFTMRKFIEAINEGYEKLSKEKTDLQIREQQDIVEAAVELVKWHGAGALKGERYSRLFSLAGNFLLGRTEKRNHEHGPHGPVEGPGSPNE